MLSSFLYSLGGGLLLVLVTGRPDQLAWRFTRLVGLIVFALIALPLAWHLRADEALSRGSVLKTALPAVTAAAGFSLAGMAPVLGRLRGVFHSLCLIGGLAGLVAGFLPLRDALGSLSPGTRQLAFVFAGQALGALLLGSITLAWLLGHAYLTATRMTIAPLRHFSRFLIWAVTARLAFFVGSVILAWRFGGSAWDAFAAGMHHSALTWVFVSLRAGVGLLAVGAFAWMVRDCVRLRATQSATGILYFGSVFAYVGELCGQQLLTLYGWPV